MWPPKGSTVQLSLKTGTTSTCELKITDLSFGFVPVIHEAIKTCDIRVTQPLINLMCKPSRVIITIGLFSTA